MSREELIQYLQENLGIKFVVQNYSTGKRIKLNLILERQIISSTEINLENNL